MGGLVKLPRPFSKWTTYPGHGGIDFPRARNTPVPASGNGVVTFAGYYSARGGYAKFVQYDNGPLVGYYHFDSQRGIGVGARVRLGSVVGYVGSLGSRSTGPHLHMEVWRNGRILRPDMDPGFWDFIDSTRFVGEAAPAAPAPTPAPTPNYPQEDDMAYPVNYNGNLFLLAPGHVKHFTKDDDHEWAKNVAAPEDRWISIANVKRWNTILDMCGIPRTVVKITKDSVGVLNPESGKFEAGGLWRWDRDRSAYDAAQ